MTRRTMPHRDDPWAERLSEYLDGLLTGSEALELEAHLTECAECREIAGDLARIRDAAGTFESAPPARDLWPEIRSAMEAPRVIHGAGRRGVFLSLPQLTAIAAAFVVVTAWGAWQTAGIPGPTTSSAASGSGSFAVEAGASTPREPVRLAADRDPSVAAAADEVDRLQRLLGERRGTLAPGTVDVLEKNLAIIDRAIRESLAALQVDPGNQFVEEHLRLSVERKVDYLRQATSLPGRAS